MRRWLTLFLLFMLPVQFSWAAAAAYCQHEAAAAQTHIGHHAHEHEATPGDAQADAAGKHDGKHDGKAAAAKGGKLVADNDCGYCHLSVAKSMVPVAGQLPLAAQFVIDIGPLLAFQSRGPDRHERPKWRIA
jgi:hypothetical protein